MIFDSTRSLLQSIVLTLEDSGDEGRWDDQAESGNACLYEMHQMSGRLYKAYKTDAATPQSSLTERLRRAIPHVRLMTIAIRSKDRMLALENGRAGLAEMNGSGLCSPAVRFAGPNSDSHAPTPVPREIPKPAGAAAAAPALRPSRRTRIASNRANR
jgi:hypothetical protein